ncbi:MAG: hypothetical protein HZA53_10545 [Planctomycetes bacterium]|nr:hypothetical protein [Planctomycetota bacterium]
MIRLHLALPLALLASCATVMTGHQDTIEVLSTPPGAKFTTNTALSGVTPAKVQVSDEVDVEFTFTMDGYTPLTAESKKRISGWVLGNILIGGIIGLCIDSISGGMHTHDAKLEVTLVPADAPAPKP